MYVSKDSMWRRIWKFLQNFLGTKQGLSGLLLRCLIPCNTRMPNLEIDIVQSTQPAALLARLHTSADCCTPFSFISSFFVPFHFSFSAIHCRTSRLHSFRHASCRFPTRGWPSERRTIYRAMDEQRRSPSYRTVKRLGVVIWCCLIIYRPPLLMVVLFLLTHIHL
jgi:hypothetical protein